MEVWSWVWTCLHRCVQTSVLICHASSWSNGSQFKCGNHRAMFLQLYAQDNMPAEETTSVCTHLHRHEHNFGSFTLIGYSLVAYTCTCIHMCARVHSCFADLLQATVARVAAEYHWNYFLQIMNTLF